MLLAVTFVIFLWLADEIVDFVDEATKRMPQDYPQRAREYHNRISQLCAELYDGSDVPASVIAALEDGLRLKVDYVGRGS